MDAQQNKGPMNMGNTREWGGGLKIIFLPGSIVNGPKGLKIPIAILRFRWKL